jgi:ABC-2 type transport system ATP-binding protein
LVQVTNLTKRYGEKTALDNVCFSIGAGEVVGLVGLNGAGKSTTMNILTGYISATNGKVLIGGFDIASDGGKAKRLIGYLPEQPAYYPEIRVNEHLDFICGLKGVYKNQKARAEHISDICSRVGISDVLTRMVRNLSKGYRQRVGFAQALIGHPKVIILDEPTAGLDPSQLIEMRSLVKECGKDSTVIVSSHILSEVQTVCSRVLVINEGQLIADDTPENLTGKSMYSNNLTARIKGDPDKVTAELRKAEGVTQVRRKSKAEPGTYEYIIYGGKENDIREAVFYALAKAGLPIFALHSSEASLEDVFLQLTREGTTGARSPETRDEAEPESGEEDAL